MFDVLKSYFKDSNNYIIITDNSFYIKNYKKIRSIDSNEVIVELYNKTLKINGDDFALKRNVGGDIEISGNVISYKVI